MPGLTPKQSAFCLAYIETGNASEAYRRCYSAENMKPASVNTAATELLRNGKIKVRISERVCKVDIRNKLTHIPRLENSWKEALCACGLRGHDDALGRICYVTLRPTPDVVLPFGRNMRPLPC